MSGHVTVTIGGATLDSSFDTGTVRTTFRTRRVSCRASGCVGCNAVHRKIVGPRRLRLSALVNEGWAKA